MTGSAEHARIAEARCVTCTWERRSGPGCCPQFVTRHARRHAATWGHEVQVKHEVFTVYGPSRPARAVPKQYRDRMVIDGPGGSRTA